MNTYICEFVCKCPSDGAAIDYLLEIKSLSMVMVEDILELVNGIGYVYQEELADILQTKFGGCQKLTARHQGVLVITERM